MNESCELLLLPPISTHASAWMSHVSYFSFHLSVPMPRHGLGARPFTAVTSSVNSLDINIAKPCDQYPSLGMDESCKLLPLPPISTQASAWMSHVSYFSHLSVLDQYPSLAMDKLCKLLLLPPISTCPSAWMSHVSYFSSHLLLLDQYPCLCMDESCELLLPPISTHPSPWTSCVSYFSFHLSVPIPQHG